MHLARLLITFTQSVWTQIRSDKTLGMVWIQTAWHIYLDLYILLLSIRMSSCLNYPTVIWSVHWYRDWLFLFKPILSYQGLRLSYLTKGRYDETFAGEDGSNQGRCRVFESGPADETIECGKIETWESTRDPLSMVAIVRAPRRKRILTASLCVLNTFFAEFGTRFQSFLVTNFLSKMQGTIFRVKAVTISLTYVLFHFQHTLSPDMFFDLA